MVSLLEMDKKNAEKELRAELERLVPEKYPLLRVVEGATTICLEGGLSVCDESGHELAVYQIRIEFPAGFPDNIPILYEIGGKIPRISDRHVDGNGAACLCVRDEIYKYCPPGYSVDEFMQGLVIPFFRSQIVFEETGVYPGERQHGIDGILDFYEEALGTRAKDIVIAFLEYLTSSSVKGHHVCYCGSQKKLRDCHFHVLQKYRGKIRNIDAKKSLYQLRTGRF